MPLALSKVSPADTPSASPRAASPSFLRRRVGARDRLFFTEQLALMLESGVSLHAALEGLKDWSDNPPLQKLVSELASDIEGGRSFSAALAGHPDVFSTSYVNLVAASEQGGFMHKVLEQILRMESKREELRSSMLSAFFYPGFLLVFSLLVVVFVLVVVFPKFGPLFVKIQDQLPLSTKALMGLSASLSQHWVYWLAGLAIGVIGARVWLTSAGGVAVVDRLKLYAPVLRGIYVELYLVRCLRVLGLSLSNGVSVVDALSACRDVVDNSVYRRFLVGVEQRVHEGAGVAVGFLSADFAPPVVKQMIATGEQTGSLARVMTRLADHYEDEFQKRLTRFSKLAEPVMLLVMGLLVGTLVSSLILPIFKLSRAVG